MTAVDAVWIAGTVLFVFGMVSLGVVAWSMRPSDSDRYGGLLPEKPRHVNVVRRPFDWSRYRDL